MSIQTDRVNSWLQLSLFEQPVLLITTKIGVVFEAEHLQAQITVSDAIEGTLIGALSIPHRDFRNLDRFLDQIVVELRSVLEAACPPF